MLTVWGFFNMEKSPSLARNLTLSHLTANMSKQENKHAM